MTGPSEFRKRPLLAIVMAGALAAAPLAAAEAGEGSGYAGPAKAVIARLLAGREFSPEAGCESRTTCETLLARLRAGDFTVVAPAERSARPDLPSYLRLRKRCPGLDPLRVTLAHHVFAATRNFAAYRLEPPRQGRRGEEIIIFHAQHYVELAPRRAAALAADEPATLLPGTFVATGLPGCRVLATAQAEDGDWFAKHNAVGEGDHAGELLRLDGGYVVLDITPVAGPHQPKPSWWYTLDLWDLGIRAEAGRRRSSHLYSFGYKPGAALPGASHAVGVVPSPG